MKLLRAPIISNNEIAPAIWVLWLQAPEIAAAAEPGQFVMVETGDGYDPLLKRAFSVFRVSGDDSAAPERLGLLYTPSGRGSSRTARRRPGESVEIIGPLGRGYNVPPQARNLLMVAGGVGIAPIAFLAERAIAKGRSVTILQGGASAQQLFPGQELPPEVELVTATLDGSAGRQGLVTDMVPEHLDWADQVFACGPMAMYRTLAGQLPRLPSRKQCQVLLETPMACGFGLCYTCAVETRRGTKLVCKEGPCFDLREIDWEALP
ncbi:MAG: dihydroorotate dehydrogenase electron transfer subunit [Dehalococcoidia bacterium]|nr:dihydroorotate dehydrogenase electron transfer subunit [Dehalococcoidia bacterium]